MVASREANAGQNYNINTDNTSFEIVEHFKYWEKTLTYQNSIQEEINPYPSNVENRVSS